MWKNNLWHKEGALFPRTGHKTLCWEISGRNSKLGVLCSSPRTCSHTKPWEEVTSHSCLPSFFKRRRGPLSNDFPLPPFYPVQHSLLSMTQFLSSNPALPLPVTSAKVLILSIPQSPQQENTHFQGYSNNNNNNKKDLKLFASNSSYKF